MYNVLVLACLAGAALSAPLSNNSTSSDAKSAFLKGKATYEANTRALLQSNGTSNCSLDNVVVRRAWDDLSQNERANYIQAVHCLYSLPSRTPLNLAPGVRNWVDDYVYTHIDVTNFIHISGLFLPWHRQFIWSYERDLRDKCGYEGYLPYWAWERHENQSTTPVFQPDSNSFGGDGQYVPHGVISYPPVGLPNGSDLEPITITRQPGKGGGCVTNGAFANITLHLGPVTPQNASINTPDNIYGTKYNPRCLTRDFQPVLPFANLDYTDINNLFNNETIEEFHPMLELTAHGMSHWYIGGENVDLYTSPNDPAFFLLHSQVDRVWSMWQGLDYEARKLALDGTLTMFNLPPSPNATLSSIMRMGVPAGGDLPISHSMSTIENDYCYMYL